MEIAFVTGVMAGSEYFGRSFEMSADDAAHAVENRMVRYATNGEIETLLEMRRDITFSDFVAAHSPYRNAGICHLQGRIEYSRLL